jgi:catechol 2,3-dioxygenase-like lactoylglutathione lyase family enzyme
MKIISPGRQTTVGCIDHLTLSSGDVQDNLKVYVNELSFRDMHRFVSLLFLLYYPGGLATSRPAPSFLMTVKPSPSRALLRSGQYCNE